MDSILKAFLRLAVAAGVILLAGCAAKYGPGQLARDWSCKIREMQVRPLFPPREDFHVGDVYWLDRIGKTDADGYCSSGGTGADQTRDFLPIPLHVAYFPEVNRTADAHYKSRPDFPRMTAASGTVTLSTAGLVVTANAQTTDPTSATASLFLGGSANRTRLVGFPDFMSVKIDKFSLGAIIPIQGMFTPFGLSTEDVDEASISIPVAESYSVPVANALAAVPSAAGICQIPSYVRGGTVDASAGAFLLVTEVYYTRAIDVNIQSKSALALGIARDRQNAGTTTLPALTTTGIVTPGAVASSPQSTMTVGHMQAVAGGMLQILAARNAVPGVSLAYEQGRSSTISMRRIFDRPVAIGYRGIAVAVRPAGANGLCTFQVSSASPTGTGPAMVVDTGLAPATGGTVTTGLPKQ